jgi:hypothetical protein
MFRQLAEHALRHRKEALYRRGGGYDGESDSNEVKPGWQVRLMLQPKFARLLTADSQIGRTQNAIAFNVQA